jgi:lipopolysaccharide/colanic/teichoic acid biosynthesis glycosyltransferase
MRGSQRQVLSAALRLALPLALGAALLLALRIRFSSGWFAVEDLPSWPAYVAYLVAAAAAWSAMEARYSLIERLLDHGPALASVASIVKIDLLSMALVSSAAFFWRGYSFSRWTVALTWALHIAFCSVGALALRAWLRRSEGRRAFWVLAAGDSVPSPDALAECIPEGAAVRFSHCADAAALAGRILAGDVPAGCRELLAVLPSSQAHELPAVAAAAERLPISAAVAIRDFGHGHMERAGSYAVFGVGAPAGASFDYVFLKRASDVALSAAGLVALAPVLLLIAAITWTRSGRPVLITQERVGRGGRRFRLHKFRSLPVAALRRSDFRWTEEPADGWGRFLRSTGLDELPQLLDVLRGDMSLVGPRPERPRFVEEFRRQLPFYSTRHRLRPGITGWAQVNGLRGDTSIAHRVEHDLYYLRHWSLALDVRILCLTVANFLGDLRRAARAPERSANAGSV